MIFWTRQWSISVALVGMFAASLVRPAAAVSERPAPNPGRWRAHPAAVGGLLEVAGAPQVCSDSPKGWADTWGYTCSTYAERDFCTSDGSQGHGWKEALWGPMGNYAYEGKTATEACCTCGGGASESAAACTSMACPIGYSLLADAATIYCKGVDCTTDADLESCCEAAPGVQAAVDEVNTLTAKLEEEVQTNISKAGAEVLARTQAESSELAQKQTEQLRGDSKAQRSKALDAARAHFDKLTALSEDLPEVARYQIETSGFLAARAVTQSYKVDGTRLREQAHRASGAFADAAKAWQTTQDASNLAVGAGSREWAAYHADLNATWPRLVAGINAVNDAQKSARDPLEEVRITAQSSRLAADYAQTVQAQVDSLSSQVGVQEQQAAQAERATKGNAQRIRELEDLVARTLGGQR